MKKLFISYYNGDEEEIILLAEELKLRGIVPWIDKQGGYYLGDSAPEKARYAIRQECYGMLFYATPRAFKRPFITNVELPEAIYLLEQSPGFILFAVPRYMDFKELSEMSIKILGTDLSTYHTQQIKNEDSKEQGLTINQFRNLADLVLRQKIKAHSKDKIDEIFNFQFSTRELLPWNENELLCINAIKTIGNGSASDSQLNWERVVVGLKDVKAAVAENFGRPRLRIHGSKHLTAAYILGRVFSRPSGFILDIRQGDDYWSSDYPDDGSEHFSVRVTDGSVNSQILFVEITTTGKNVSNAVRERIRQTGDIPYQFIAFNKVNNESSRVMIDNRICMSMARQIRDNIVRIIAKSPVREIHIFSSIPQGLAVMIGYYLNAFPAIQLYEYDGVDYYPSFKIGTPF